MEVYKKKITEQDIGKPALFTVTETDAKQLKRAPFGRQLKISVKTRSQEENKNAWGKTHFVFDVYSDILPGEFASVDEFYNFIKCHVGWCHSQVVELGGQKVIYRTPRASNFKDQKDETEYVDKLKLPLERYLCELVNLDPLGFEDEYNAWKGRQ